MQQFEGKVAAVTGAASGIGRALAVELAGRGCHLALCDVDEVGLGDTVARAEAAGAVRITSALVDVADRTAVESWAGQAIDDHGGVQLVVNNAGVSLTAPVTAMTDDSFRWLMDINFWGVVYGTRAFLPHFEAADEGHIVNLSSVFGLVPIPTQSAYNAAKFGVRGFTEALRIELELAGSNVSATCVHPGGIKTNIVRNGRFEGPDSDPSQVDEMIARTEQAFRTTPERAAVVILQAVERNRRRCLVGADARLFAAAAHLPAGVYGRLIRLGQARMAR